MVQQTARPDQITLEQHIKTAISQNPQFPDQISHGVKKTPLFFKIPYMVWSSNANWG